MTLGASEPRRDSALSRHDIRALARVVRILHERRMIHKLFGYIAVIIDNLPDLSSDEGDSEVDLTIKGTAADCAILSAEAAAGEDRGGSLVIDNQTGDTVCFQVYDFNTGATLCAAADAPCIFDAKALPEGVEILPGGKVCVPPGISTVPIAADAPSGIFQLDFPCVGNGGGPKLIIPPPQQQFPN